jgi:HD superfamily phosphodiesterase
VPRMAESEQRYLDLLVNEVQAVVGDEASHGMRHAVNTMDLAKRIWRVEGGDLFVIQAAALLHDIGRVNIFSDPSHGRRGATLAREILDRLDIPTDRALICLIIARHDDREDDPDVPIELSVVKDADRLELLRIAPEYLELNRLVTLEALRQVPYALSLHYPDGIKTREVTATIEQARKILKDRGA